MRKERQRVAQETLQILDSGVYVSSSGTQVAVDEAVRRCVSGTRCYSPNELDGIPASVRREPENPEAVTIEVSDETTLAGARRLAGARPDSRFGALNFASARNPGGGFESGAQAQEESLARCSGLFRSLARCRAFYEYHRRQNNPLYSDRVIHSPDCPVFRADDGLLLDAPYYVDFLTCAAPNAGAIKHKQPADTPRIEPVFRERMGKVLGVAHEHGCRNLVLGAWGCGVFGNDPMMVANLFREYLGPGGMFERRFEYVLFAVFDPSRERSSYRAFSRVFSTS